MTITSTSELTHSTSTATPRSDFKGAWLAAWTLGVRELVRFFRQRNRVIGALGQPVIFWLLFGFGLGPTFRWDAAGAEQISYREYFFPGTLALIVLFTAIFTTISIIEDRREGFLQSVLVAPIPRWSMVFGKLWGGSLIALLQTLVFLALGRYYSWWSLVAVIPFTFVLALGLTGLGFLIAWRMDSTQGFHAVMSVFLFPMWLLSGAFFPPSGWLGWVILSNPLTYGVAGLRRLLYFEESATPAWLDQLPSMAVCWAVNLGFAALMFLACCGMARQRVRGDLL